MRVMMMRVCGSFLLSCAWGGVVADVLIGQASVRVLGL